jgi:hypothetical protein
MSSRTSVDRGALPRLRGRTVGTMERCLACEAVRSEPWSDSYDVECFYGLNNPYVTVEA